MASLTGCIKRAGPYLHDDDKAAILEASQASRQSGQSTAEAAARTYSRVRGRKDTVGIAADAGRERPSGVGLRLDRVVS